MLPKRILTIIATSVVAVFIGVSTANADTYTVQSGDTLTAIAEQHDVSVNDLQAINSIADINVIFAGENLETVAVTTPATTEVAPVVEQPTQPAPMPVATQTSSAKEWIANKESGGSYTAYNPSGAYGRYQLMPFNLKYGASPDAQERAADEYVASRYGSWEAAKSFWLAHNWY